MVSVVRWSLMALACAAVVGAPAAAQAQTGVVAGRVVDSVSNQPIANVTVSVVGTQLGALTREDGRYSLGNVPTGAQRVRVNRIGYGAQEREVQVAAGATATADFTLSTVAARLSEVVVTGYGTQRREAITGSVAQVTAEEANVGVVANANQLIQGRVAGVNMTVNNGEPGGGAQIRIRGGTSISASNDPLYVIDGMPLQNEGAVSGGAELGGINRPLGRSPLNTINPNDIESITVLKDASATAIYGSRGANGVILITTKQGSSRGSSVEYDTYVATSSAANTLDFLTGDQYRAYVTEQVGLWRADSANNVPATDRRGLASSRLATLGTANTDWEDEIMRRGYATNHNLAFSGGSQTTQYRASLNYFKQEGVVLSNGLTRYQGRLNGTTQALQGKLRLGLNMTASRVNNDYAPYENGGGFEGGIFTNMAIFNPTQPVKVQDPATGQMVYYELGPGSQSVRNPVGLAEQVTDISPENRVLGNVTAGFSILPNLTSQTTVGVDYTSAVRQTYFPLASPVGAQVGGLARQEERTTQNVNFQQLLTYAPNLGERSDVEVIGGYEYSEFDNRGFGALAQGFITDAFLFNNLGAGTQATSPAPFSYIQESQLVSFFGRATYGFARKYFLTGVIRYDGSSRLAEGNQWSTFPAISASWRLSEEEFMASRPFGISSLGVRAGFGRQGNQAVRPYGTQLLLRADQGARYPFGSTVYTGLVAAQVANPDLRWETAEQLNVGIDYGFSNDRFSGVLDFYQKNTKDLILEVSVPQPAVVSTRLENIGSVRNNGVEATLDVDLLQTATRQLTTGLILSVERNEVVSLGGSRTFINTGFVSGAGQSNQVSQRIMVGEPIGTFWGPTFLGVNAAGRQTFACTIPTGSTRTDCVDGVTTSPTGDDLGVIGNANPDFSAGLRSNLTWGRFDASWLWRGEFGKDVFNNTALVYATKSNVNQNRNFLASALDDPTRLGEPAIYSSRWIEDGSFVRLSNVTVGMTFDLPNTLGFGRGTRVYLSGDNLLLMTDYSGYDPEVFTDLGLATRGIDYLTYPRARTFQLGARVQF
jgi:TonB-dependent starch-binding outer membrane protein SusC